MHPEGRSLESNPRARSWDASRERLLGRPLRRSLREQPFGFFETPKKNI